MAYLHDHGIVHRDLKPANMFMEEGLVKIGDYGLAKLITPSQGTEHSESIGTCHYMAPEIASGKYHKPIDVYAIGVILYEMLTGRVPFDGETVGEVLMKHLTARPDARPLPEPYRSIVARALAKDPNQRPARVYDLLPPEDAPRRPTSGSSATARPRPPPARGGVRGRRRPAAPKKDDGVFRIEAEEPVFYIGPETRPPRRRQPAAPDRLPPPRPPRRRRPGPRRRGRAAPRRARRRRRRRSRPRRRPRCRAPGCAWPSWPRRCSWPPRSPPCSPCRPRSRWGSTCRRNPSGSPSSSA